MARKGSQRRIPGTQCVETRALGSWGKVKQGERGCPWVLLRAVEGAREVTFVSTEGKAFATSTFTCLFMSGGEEARLRWTEGEWRVGKWSQ